MTAIHYPRLNALGLTASDFRSLRRQGFVQAESRGKTRFVFKLRYRVNGRQRVRYLGTDRRVAEDVTAELHQLQEARDGRRELAAVRKPARQAERAARRAAAELLAPYGLRFHGRELRKTRVAL